MSMADLSSLLPLVVLAVGSLVVLLAAAFMHRLGAAFALTMATIAAALVFAIASWNRAPFSAGGLLSFDRFVLFGIILILAATLFAAVSSWSALRSRETESGDFFFLLVVASLGACILAASTAFASFFLGLELLAVSLYGLIGWRREQAVGIEAAIKYLVLAGASSAFLLFGMAMVYAATGTMDLFRLAETGAGAGIAAPLGLGIMLVAVGFKLAVVPFHMWTPDVYDGAPAPVTGYIASVSKGAMVVVLARAFAPLLTGSAGSVLGAAGAAAGAAGSTAASGQGPLSMAFPWVLAVVAAASMFGGNILALRENNVKRILAYSSIAHLGYVLVAFVAAGAEGLRAVTFYLVAYFAATLGAFAVIAEVSTRERDADSVGDFKGLAASRPGLAAALTAMLLSLAGLPLTAGFIGKFLILRAGSGAELWVLAVILVVNSTISIFYYLKIVSSMFRGFTSAHEEAGATGSTGSGVHGAGGGMSAGQGVRGAAIARTPFIAALALAVLVLTVVALGVYPSPLLGFIGSFTGFSP
jgi:NADH-quinone oxidoreductase subunit N